MNLMTLMGVIQDTITKGENSEYVKDIKQIVVKEMNEQFNCGYDRANTATIMIVDKIAEYAKLKGVI